MTDVFTDSTTQTPAQALQAQVEAIRAQIAEGEAMAAEGRAALKSLRDSLKGLGRASARKTSTTPRKPRAKKNAAAE